MRDTDDVCRRAQALARNTGWCVFPCGDDKRPTLKGWPERASAAPEAIARMWADRPGALVGVATGEASGIDVLDIDAKDDAALWFWQDHCARLLPTRTYATRSGGLHLYFRHSPGIRNTQGKLCSGVDTRGDRGYVIFWFADGFRCWDPAPPQPWPIWLLIRLTQKPTVAPPVIELPTERAIGGILRRVETAKEGERNAVLYWAACRFVERDLSRTEAAALLLPVATAAGLDQTECLRTIASAYQRGGRAA